MRKISSRIDNEKRENGEISEKRKETPAPVPESRGSGGLILAGLSFGFFLAYKSKSQARQFKHSA